MVRYLASASMIFCFALGLLACHVKQEREKENEEYVYTRIRDVLGEVPKLAWVLADGTLAADSRSPEIAVYSTSPTIQIAKRRSTLSPKETLEFAAKNKIACDARLEQKPLAFSLYTSTTKPGDRNPQVLFTSKVLPVTKGGFQQVPLDDRLGAEIWERMNPVTAKQLRNGIVIRQEGTGYFYSFAALYEGANKEISRYGIFLHSEDGHVVASEVNDLKGEWCADCAMPTFDDGMDALFLVENLYSSTKFRYPVLLLDTSTVEGRSLSLATFSPDGKYSIHLFYEYVVGCPQ